MGLSVGVALSRGKKPVFPPECVVCRTPEPTATISVGSTGWALTRSAAAFQVDVPMCPTCIGPFTWQRRWRALSLYLAAFTGVGAALWIAGEWRTFAVLIGGAVTTLPATLYQMLVPLPLDITVRSAEVDYDFRDAAQACAFAWANDVPPPEI